MGLWRNKKERKHGVVNQMACGQRMTNILSCGHPHHQGNCLLLAYRVGS